MSRETTASVSTHILDTATGRPAVGVTVLLSARTGTGAPWTALGSSATDEDGRCRDLPALPAAATRVRLEFGTEAYFLTGRAEARQDAPEVGDGAAAGVFFPEVAVAFAVVPGEHYHVPLLLGPFGYTVYRGS
ncbi:hydroxyisourate hydrolase [Streptomyces sp. NPDC004838]